MAKVYCLKRKKTTKELHLFVCEPTQTSGCICDPVSICEKMQKSDSEGENIFCCVDEDTARIKCAEISRDVCGTCVSHLYETYD